VEKDEGQKCRNLEKKIHNAQKNPSPSPSPPSRREYGSLALEEKLNKNAKLKIMNPRGIL